MAIISPQVRTVDFLPEIFQTPVTRQFLNATLDQLTQEPEFKKTQGYIGQKVGPGVNPADGYVIEPTASRNDYQLEPGVVQLDPNKINTIVDAITFPGITDAMALQGGYTNNASRLYTSEYYTFDPFVDFDKFVNFAEYYWLPAGPLAVTVTAAPIPMLETIDVTRANGKYTFSNAKGENPNFTLVRGGNYTFNIAQNAKETINYRVSNNVNSTYIIDYVANPVLTLTRGNTYNFNLSLSEPYGFYIKTVETVGTTNQWTSGVTNNGAITGTVSFTVPQDAPDTVYYCNDIEPNLRGQINIIDATPGTGAEFWIQSQPGVNGGLPWAPNISSRTVLGVTNNGIDLGQVTFNVPAIDAQTFYYTLYNVGTVDLITDLLFDQINNVPVDQFLATYGGIDGIQNINGRTVVFTNQTNNGWDFNALPMGFDSDPYAYADPIVDPALRYSIWRISYVNIDGTEYIQLNSVRNVADLSKFTIIYGTEYSSTQWYKNSSGFFEEIPLLTAIQDVIYYQDGTDPTIFGEIRIVEEAMSDTLDVADILDHKTYTSPNGVVFTNGLKVTFEGSVVPSSYQGNTYYVEGVGTAIKLLPISNFVTPETYTQSASTPYASTPYDIGNYDATLNAPILQDYITINRASPDLNAWTRSNRWFHIDVINASAAYNNVAPVVDNLQRGTRPILEFRAGTRLFDFGTEGKQPINIIDLAQTDAFSNVNGQTSYSINGYTLEAGSRVIFAKDSDPTVRNQIYVVEFITPDTVPPLIAEPIIHLVPATDNPVLVNATVVVLSGDTLQGTSYYYDGVEWILAQQKIKTNQPPLFDVYDSNGISFSNKAQYPSSTFAGSKLFSYTTPSTAQKNTITSTLNDPILGFQLTYLSLNNVGDILFDNNLYIDTFVYVPNNLGTTMPISSGFVRQYSDRINYVEEIGWQTAVTKSISRQQFQFSYTGQPLQLDVAVATETTVPAVQIFVDSIFIESNRYTVTVNSNTTIINLLDTYALNAIIEVAVISDQISKTGFYQVPINLENNPLNNNSQAFTLGTIRNHYSTICENLNTLSGPITGANNTRDLGNIVPYGLQILQQSSPMTLAGYFMRSKQYDIFASLNYNSREYIKFKSKLLDQVVSNDYGTMTPSQILDAAIAEINIGKTSINPFYWSDMLPTGSVYTQTVTTVTAITTATFNTIQTYNFTSANYLGLCVYIQRANSQARSILLTRSVDYTVSTDTPQVTINITLNIGDKVIIVEYPNTTGNFVPNTPTKLGLYPKFIPEIFVDTNYVNPTPVIQGHDGSITVAFGDIRDQVLLEFEQRIYSNLKTDGNPVPLTVDEVQPGFFRTTDYSQTEINAILGESFLSWVGWNKLDYKKQDYNPNNEFTYNYSQSGNRINGEPMLGAWRGIYRWMYDTTTPNLTPWEMLGFSEEPTWWQNYYGPAPYTSDNLVLWDDLEAGLVADPVAPYVKPNYRRPGLSKVIPVGTDGELLPPLESVAGLYDPTSFQKSWNVGDGGPVENAWWTSSSYPFAVMRLLALTRPAEFFSLFADRDLYRYNDALGQYLYNGRYRLNANEIQVYGNGVSKASFIDWIVDYNQQLGINSTTGLTTDLANLDVRLCYRMAAFSDPRYLEIYLEKSSPNSQNTSLLLPPQSYNLLVYKNEPFASLSYSALIVEIVQGGYAVYGYSNTDPYFKIFASSSSGILKTITSGGTTVQVPAQYTDEVVQVPYGYTFTNITVVVDFILSYGKYLESQGLVFDDQENGYTLDWGQMANEFLYFSQQGWAQGTLINLNPVATTLKAVRPGAVVDTIVSVTPDNMVLDQNRQTLDTRNLIVQREGNQFMITSTNNQTISYIELRYTSFEHMIVLDNLSIFNDLIYDTTTAARQERVELIASTTTEWNGVLNAQGFILNDPATVKEWQPYVKYTKGDIVLHKNNYWQASTIVQPSETFNTQYWYKSNYDRIDPGLLPNLANKADQLANSYDIHKANLNSDNDLLAYGLIGYRPRQYMAALNLDNVTQVNLYQQFLGTKGTRLAAELFTRANLGKETGQYKIYENWGVLAATYGANANRSFYELRLNEADLQANPATIQVTLPGETSAADQTVLLQDVWKSSNYLTSPNILPTTYVKTIDTALPSAGYVNLDDVDITVYTLDNPSNIAAHIDTIGVGTIIWVAKVNTYNWGIYRCALTTGTMFQVQNNLDGTSVCQFDLPHGLVFGDLIVIKYFNSGVNGVYRVLSVPAPNSITIAFAFTNTSQTSVTGTGLVFKLQTMRVSQASDVATLPYSTDLIPGARAWVDSNGLGHWEVLEKTQPFTAFQALLPYTTDINASYGFSISQATDNSMAMVGAPFDNSGAGALYFYTRDASNSYAINTRLTLNAVGVEQFGASTDGGSNTWGVIGAPGSNGGAGYAVPITTVNNSAVIPQLLVSPDQNFTATAFGGAVTISQDERWMYISAAGNNAVFAYTRVDVERQIVYYVGDGSTTTFNYDALVQISSSQADQLLVVVNTTTQQSTVDYNISGGNVVFNTAPGPGIRISIARRPGVEFTYTSGTPTFTLAPWLYTASNIYSVTVEIDGQIQRPYIDYVYNINNSITLNVAPASGTKIDVIASTYWQYVNKLPVPNGVESDAAFGFSLTTGDDGRTIFVGAPYDDVNGEEYGYAGAVYAVDRSVVAYQVTNINQSTYTIPGSFTGPVSVSLNGKFLTNGAYYINGEYTVSGSDITLSNSVVLTVGDILEIGTNQFTVIEKIVSNAPANKASFGFATNVCHSSCSLYTGAPYDSTVLPEAGSVQRNLNQSRVYGVTTSTIANPSLTAGNTLRINDFQVTVPNAPNNTVAGLVAAINAANVPNAAATLTPNLSFVGDGTNKIFYIGNLYSAASAYTTVVYVDNVLQTSGVDYTYNSSTNQIFFVNAPLYKSAITVVSGRMTVSVKNAQAATPKELLTVLPGTTGTAFFDLGFNTYPWVQRITSPNPTDYAHFGESINIDSSSVNLVVGAPNGTIIEPVTFDGGETYFDDHSTTFMTPVVNSGVVYTFDYLSASNPSITNPGAFVFGQQIFDNNVSTNDRFGQAVNYTGGRLMVGGPGHNSNYGIVSVFENTQNLPAWKVIHEQQPVVDINLLDGVFSYDRLTSGVQTYYDFFDPLQGKILGAARQNIDYIGAVDPAQYNQGSVHNNGNSWADEHVGEMWWDTNTVRFIDPNQDDIVYASRRWGQIFPGSSVDIYQWVSSSVPPSSYTGPGVPLSATSYTVSTVLDKNDILATRYYFWARGITTIQTGAGKTLSATGVASYITNPRSSGIVYLAPLNSSTVAIYNANNLVSATDTILNIGYDRQATINNVHQEYQFISDGRPNSFLNDSLYRKLQDSFCGADETGANVPDPALSPAERYGVQFRPRQSMFADRFVALENYLTHANTILAQFPISETRSFNLLNSSEPIPSQVLAAATGCSISGNVLTIGTVVSNGFQVGMTVTGGTIVANTVITAVGPTAGTYVVSNSQTVASTTITGTLGYNKAVANLEELGYQNLKTVPVGYLYLVISDSSEYGLWTIYQVNNEVINGVQTGNRILNLLRIQNYDTKLYWTYINWYLPGYNNTIQPLAQVPNYSSLSTVSFDTAPLGGSVKVDANGQGKWEIYQRTGIDPATGWTRVGLQDGTIEFDAKLWNYSLGNFGFDAEVFDAQYFDEAPQIETRQIIQAINEELFVDDLLVERNQSLILMFNFIYTEFTAPEWLIKTSLIDVDHNIRALLPYQIYQQDNQTFVLDYIQEVKPYHVQLREFNLIYTGEDVYPGGLTDFDVPAYYNTALEVPQYVSPVLTPYTYSNTLIPQNITSDAAPDAQIWATTPWSDWFNNYESNSNLVRSIKTVIKYDRCEYTSNVTEWQANTSYVSGQLVRYLDQVWLADGDIAPAAQFDPAFWTMVDAGTLSGSDRTMGYYLPTANEPGLSLPLLIDGIDYPGVQVTAPTFDQNTGFDVGNYAINPYDNISYSPDGYPTYDYGILDAMYSSSYLDIYLGTRPTDINVDGGAYVDTYSSHAPEELVPGAEFDTLDFRVYTTPGADWLHQGHGFPNKVQNYTFNPSAPTMLIASDADALPYLMSVVVTNQTQGYDLNLGHDYTVNWVDRTITVTNRATAGDIISINSYEIGGGNQLYKNRYNGADVGTVIVVPIEVSMINEFAIFVNGTYTTNYAYVGLGHTTVVTFDTEYTIADDIVLVAIGLTPVGSSYVAYSWSAPQTQYFVANGTNTNFALTNNLEYTNPDNVVVTVNGSRVRTAGSALYIGDNSQTVFALPTRLSISPSLIAANQVRVYVDGALLIQNVDYFVTASPTDVTFATAPATGAQVLVAVHAGTQCYVNNTTLTFNSPPPGDSVIAVTTWNNTRQQDLLTQVFVGPTTEGTSIVEGYQYTNYDVVNTDGSVTPPVDASDFGPGSYNYSTTGSTTVNNIFLGYPETNSDRLWITLNGRRLFNNNGFTLSADGTEVILTSGLLSGSDVLIVTQFTDHIVPEAMAFRIFQDMRGLQATYRITPGTTTTLARPLGQYDDTVYVTDNAALSAPKVEDNIWGVITVNGERIMYRAIDRENNALTGLLRGTAGTGAADHEIGSIVYDMGRGNLMPYQYQNYIVKTNILANGTDTVFTAPNITTTISAAIEVYVGGTRQTSGYTISAMSPVDVTFDADNVPPSGVEVTILIRRGVTWYNPGSGTPSNGVPLQETDNQAARFLRGQ